jgi:hypothetical protein
MLFWLLIIVLLFLSMSTAPYYPYSRGWGYYRSGGFFVLFVILMCLWWMTWLPWWGHYRYWR